MRARSALGSALAVMAIAGAVHADEPPPSASKRALAATAAIVPGAVVHGSGAFVLGKKAAARKLAIAGFVGLGAAAGGLALVALTGASRRFVAPLTIVTGTGLALFVMSFTSDLYAVLAPERGTGEAWTSAPRYETRLGVFAIDHPAFDHRALVDERIDARIGPVRISGAAQFAPGSTSRRLRAEAAVRFAGPLPGRDDAPDGSFVDLELAATDHAFERDGFGSLLFEASARGRYDLVRLDGALGGAFAEALVGAGVFRDRYDTGAVDPNDILLVRFAWGLYLGRRGEASVFYDHRRDGWAGGLQPKGIATGYFGSLGASARSYVLGPWGIGADVQVGSALLAGVSILFRSEGP